MNDHLEDTLRRELREVAGRVAVPPRPAQREPAVRRGGRTRPLLVAAAVMLIVGAIAALALYGGGRIPQPAQPPRTPTSVAVRPLTADPPTVPYSFGGRLYVGGTRVPGSWGGVKHAGGVWVGIGPDKNYWWGSGAEPRPLGSWALLSPDGNSLVGGTMVNDELWLSLIDTRTGDLVNELLVTEPDRFEIAGVTDDRRVIFANNGKDSLWLAAAGDETVGIPVTMPGQRVLESTSAGLIVEEESSEALHIATVDDSGVLTLHGIIPRELVMVFNRSGSWAAYGGHWGGDIPTIPHVTAESLDGNRKLKLQPPDGGQLIVMTWEDDDLLLAEMHTDGVATGLARCSIREERCLKLDIP